VKKLLGLLGWLGLALVLGALAVWFFKPEMEGLRKGLALAGLIVTAAYTASQWRDIGRSFGGRNAKYGSIALGSVILFLGLLVGINYISNRQNKRWDLTAAQQFTLSDQTKKVLGDFKQPVAVKVYYDSDPNTGAGQKTELQTRLDSYRYLSSQLNIEYVDAVKDPAGAKQDNVTSLPTTVFTYNGKSERTTGRGEQDFTNALKRLLVGTTKKVYFVQGHGEHDPDSNDQRAGYSGAVTALKSDNFEIGKLALAQEGKIPDDAAVLIVAGPQTDLLAPEVDMLRAYLKKGGKLFLMIDPTPKVDAPPLTNVITLAKEWGMDVGDNYVLDNSGVGQMFGAGPQVPIAMNYPSHPITSGFNEMTAYFLARSVTPITGGANGHTAQAVAQTSQRSWAETNIKELLTTHKATPEFDKGDKAGPIALVSAVSAAVTDAPAGAAPDAPKPETRLVVAGDSDFASNQLLGFQGNRDFFTNSVNWLAQQEDLISIRPRDPEDRRIQLTSDQGTLIFYLTVFIIPGLLLLNGVRVWWRRR
jgi:ABC-type uncharacterized transport system involved in gliding motility auxiliary subunit